MQKQGQRFRDIRFFSAKNKLALSAHTKAELLYAGKLERDKRVLSYEIHVPLCDFPVKISLRGIRTAYRDCAWTTDFRILTADGKVLVRELTEQDSLAAPATLEKLELSRRYWAVSLVSDWKIVVTEKEAGI